MVIGSFFKYFFLYLLLIFAALAVQVYVVLEPMELYPRYYIVPVVMAALLALFPAYLERKVAKLREELERKRMEEQIKRKSTASSAASSTAKRDALTGALRKDAFNEIFGVKIMEAKHVEQPLSLIIFDIDFFKKINDTYGHLAGDKVLQEVAEVVRQNIRKSEYFVRWGGEEFIVLLPGTGLQSAQMVAEKIRRAVEEHAFDEVGRVTCSFGVTQLHPDDTIATFLQRADEALYEAKRGGRNRVVAKR